MGLYDASLGARSNETSGRAIMARQREGDVSTFHFIDNLSRAIRHGGRILIDLIPKVYSGERIVRVLGYDGTPQNVRLGAGQGDTASGATEAGAGQDQATPIDPATGQAMPVPPNMRFDGVYDLAVGKYDLVVEAGPSFSTRRQEAAEQMTEFVRAFPQAAPVLGDLMAKNMDWPGADEIAARLKRLLPPQALEDGGLPPEVQEKMQEMGQALGEMQAENQELKADQANAATKLNLDREKLGVEKFKAETDRMQADREARIDRGEAQVAANTNEALTVLTQAALAMGQAVSVMAASQASQAQATQGAMDAMVAAAVAPRQVIRDRNGRAVGVKTMVN